MDEIANRSAISRRLRQTDHDTVTIRADGAPSKVAYQLSYWYRREFRRALEFMEPKSFSAGFRGKGHHPISRLRGSYRMADRRGESCRSHILVSAE